MKTTESGRISAGSTRKYIIFGLICILVLLVAATVILGSVPPIDRDALTHHLFVPKLWLQHGGIYEIPEIPFSYYPMNLDLLYMIPLYFGNDIVAKYIHYFFALMTAWLIYQYLRKRMGANYGLLGAIFFLSIPIIVKLSITVYVDLGLVFFTTASLLLLLHWVEKDFKLRYLLLAGLCCGLAAGTKYNGLISIVILTLFVPIIYQRSLIKEKQCNRKAILYGIVFAAATFVAFSPWLIKNYVWTGNPIYPLHDSLFNPTSTPEQTITQNNLVNNENSPTIENPFVSRKILYKEPWWQIILLPVRFFFEGQDDDPQFFDGKLNPFLFLLPLLAFIRKSNSVNQLLEKQTLLIFTFLFFFFTFFQQVIRIRYIICVIHPLIILSIFGLQNLIVFISEERSSILQKFYKICYILIPVAFISYNLEYLINQYQIVQPIAYLNGKISRDQYITHFRPEYPVIKYANNLPNPAKILAIFLGNRGYYFDIPVKFDSQNDNSLLFMTAQKSATADELATALQKQGITHLVIRYDLYKDWAKKRLNQEEASRLNDFFRTQTSALATANNHGLFAISKTVHP